MFVMFIFLLSFLLFSLFVFLQEQNDVPKALLFAIDGDEDIKIASDIFHNQPTNEDYADAAAEEYLKQKDVGNIEVAGDLGELLANELGAVAQELIMNQGELDDKEVHQRILLYSYVVNNFIVDSAPTTLLAETALSVFYSHLEELSSVVYQHVSDTAAFSLYILNGRSVRNAEEIGRIYAKLSGAEQSSAKIREGNELYKNFYNRCQTIYTENISYTL